MRLLSWVRFRRAESNLLVLAQLGSLAAIFLVQRNFPLTQAVPLYSTDLPRESGSRPSGEYELVW